ncbi:methyl-accepting chemotaxis protein [Pseudoduganella albidiflava]|uniref:HAMP domain-containing protein n=1 Tax=Pseudoduganella albidiflava TaxID=321983 RepID=A0A411WSM9_9BURK|nr:methyl-accepting chemotaxis protein [Pseudoduganella albidiflava]QBH99683.1 HAMP domain-containing protein [Pseudoduganella albidiflava]GGY46853.1 methyl-accepting chemotaxis protein I [Pseudoduganella albidiflava]
MLNKLRIGPKLLLAPSVVLILLVAITACAWIGMVRQNASLENLVQVRAARLKATADIAGEAKFAHANIYQLLAWVNGSFAKTRLDELTDRIHSRHRSIEQQLVQLARVSDAEERKLVDASSQALIAYRKGVLETIEMAQMDQSIATNAMQKAERQFVLLEEDLQRLAALEKSLSETAHAAAKAEFRQLGIAMAALCVLSVALSLLVSMLVRTALLRDIRSIADVVRSLAAGRLTTAKPNAGRDEIAETARVLDQSIANLNQTLRTIRGAVQSIDTASHEIAVGNLDLSSRTEQQAGSLEETASAMASLTTAVRQNAENAREACRLAATATSMAEKGGDAVSQAVTTMESIRSSSRKIVEITGVIDSISFQTNILALNAAVEAARAGEQGRGFAVVASEVRTLAARSAAAAKEIKELIARSVSTIDDGAASVSLAGRSMGDIVSSVQQVNHIIGRISAASAEQAQGIAEVNQAVGQIDDVTQQNAALVEQAAAAAESLQEQAVSLSRAVNVFELDAVRDQPARALPASARDDERRATDSAMRGLRLQAPVHGSDRHRQRG